MLMGTYSNLQVRVLCRNTNIAILHIAHPGYVREGAEGNRHFGQVAIYPEWRPDVFMEEQLTWKKKKNNSIYIVLCPLCVVRHGCRGNTSCLFSPKQQCRSLRQQHFFFPRSIFKRFKIIFKKWNTTCNNWATGYFKSVFQVGMKGFG